MNHGRVCAHPIFIARGIDKGEGYEIDRGGPMKLIGGHP